MKKIVAFAAVAALVLGACTKTETFIASNETEAVSFGAYSGRTITKAGATDDMTQANLEKNGFGVFATYSKTANYSGSTDDFMFNQLVNKTGSAWEYTPIKYWPNPTDGSAATDQKVSFFAYAPYGNPAASEEYGIMGFEIDGTSKHNIVKYGFKTGVPNVDLLWGYKSGANLTDADKDADVNINLTRTTETIKFNFRHLLSKLGGSQDGDPATVGANGVVILANPTEDATNGFGTPTGTKITVSKIEIVSATKDKNGNTITYAADGSVQTGKLDLYTGAFTMDDENSVQNIKFSQTISADPATGESELAEDLKEVANPAKFADVKTGVTKTAVNVYKNEENPLILIPGTTPIVDVTITYVVRTFDANLDPTGERHFSEVPQTVFGKVEFPQIEAGKKYNLRILLGLMDAKFEATVDEWNVDAPTIDRNGDGIVDEKDEPSVDLPKNL